MKILRWKKEVSLMPGVTFQIVPEREMNEDAAFFDEIFQAVREAGCSFELVEQTEAVLSKAEQKR